MNTEQHPDVDGVVAEKHPVFQVTTVSKYLALLLFILLPFIGGYIGYVYAPVKLVEVERVIVAPVAPTASSSTEVEVAETEIIDGDALVTFISTIS